MLIGTNILHGLIDIQPSLHFDESVSICRNIFKHRFLAASEGGL